MRGVFLVIVLLCVEATAATPIETFYESLRAEAEARSPELAIARELRAQKGAQAHTSLARWLPRVDLQLGQNVMKDYSFLTSGQITLPPGFPSLDPRQVALGNWAVRATVPLYRRAVHATLDVSRRERDAAELAIAVKRGELDWRLRERLGGYLLASYKVATVAGSLELAATSRREAQVRFSLGSRTRIDVLRADANVLTLESRKLAAEEERQASYDLLVEYSGLDDAALKERGIDSLRGSEGVLAVAIGDFADSRAVAETLHPYLAEEGRAAALDRLAAESPAYRAVVADEELAVAQAGTLSAAEWPELALTGAVYSQNTDWGQLFSGRFISYSAGVQLTIPLWLGGSFFSARAERSHAEKAARIRRERDALRLKHEVETLRLRLASLTRTAESFRLSVESNEEIVRLSLKSYQLGRTTIVELLGSQNDLLDAKTGYAKARLELSVALRRFAALLGVRTS